MKTVRPAPTAIVVRAQATTRRMPNRSISAAAKGAVSPYRARLTETAKPIMPRDQPNSVCSGSMSNEGSEANPAAPISVTNATAATGQARWTRGFRGLPRSGGPASWTTLCAGD